MPGKKPNKRELARMKALSDMGESNRSIARQLGKGHGTIKRYLNSDVFTDPSIGKMIERIKEKEVDDLTLLGARGRQHIHEVLDEGKSSLIPLIALVDRTFQQRRLLEGKSTVNLNLKMQLILAAHEQNSGKNVNEVDVTATKTEEPQEDKPTEYVSTPP